MSPNPRQNLHVVALKYRLKPIYALTYRDPDPIEFDTTDARLRLSKGKLLCTMNTHFSSTEEARAAIEPVLHAWEVDAHLRRGRNELQFVFVGANVIDRSPSPPGVAQGVALLPGAAVKRFAGRLTVRTIRSKYPAPSGNFRLNPDADTLVMRFRGYLDGNEPLLSMAYFCLTLVERKAGGRSEAAAWYRIRKNVLVRMGELTSCRGDRSEARKVASGPMQLLSESERTWLAAAVKQLIWRLGDIRPRAALPWIEMGTLPTS